LRKATSPRMSEKSAPIASRMTNIAKKYVMSGAILAERGRCWGS
jgi:hypothetical protein